MTPFHNGRTAPEGNLPGGRVRILATMSMVSLLAACGSSGSQQQSYRPTASFAAEAAAHPQPATYDPPGSSSDPWGPYIKEASRRFDVPERWIREVMRQESGGRVTARSPVGAMGLMQVMPGTYAELRGRYGLGDDAYHPWNSIMSGTAYVREMYELYGSPGFLAAYNGGPRRLEDYLWNGRGLPAETRNYVARIGPRIDGTHPNRRAAPEVYAAAELPLNIPAGPRRGDTSTMLALREQRRAVDPGIRMASLPAGPVVRMDPIPDGSTYTQVASLDSSIGGGGPVTRMDPIPDGSTYATAAIPASTYTPIYTPPAAGTATSSVDTAAFVPPPNYAPAAMTAAYVPPAYTPPPIFTPPPVMSTASAAPLPAPPAMAPAPSLLAEAPRPPAGRAAERPSAASVVARYAPEPSRAEAPSPRTQLVLAETPRSSLDASPRPGFSLMGSAHAATIPFQQMRMPNPAVAPAPVVAAVSSPGSWGVQVGAFASANLARAAADEARGRLSVNGSKTAVESVDAGRSTLYRARVLGLSRDNAQAACEKLRSRGACIIVSPGAQS